MTMRTVRNQPRTTREDLVNDLKAAGTTVTKKTLVILQRPQGPPAQESTCTGPSKVCQLQVHLNKLECRGKVYLF